MKPYVVKNYPRIRSAALACVLVLGCSGGSFDVAPSPGDDAAEASEAGAGAGHDPLGASRPAPSFGLAFGPGDAGSSVDSTADSTSTVSDAHVDVVPDTSPASDAWDCVHPSCGGCGLSYRDCARPLGVPGVSGTYDAVMAREAAESYRISGSTSEAYGSLACGASSCVTAELTHDALHYCGVWCWSGPLAGGYSFVAGGACACPTGVSASDAWR